MHYCRGRNTTSTLCKNPPGLVTTHFACNLLLFYFYSTSQFRFCVYPNLCLVSAFPLESAFNNQLYDFSFIIFFLNQFIAKVSDEQIAIKPPRLSWMLYVLIDSDSIIITLQQIFWTQGTNPAADRSGHTGTLKMHILTVEAVWWCRQGCCANPACICMSLWWSHGAFCLQQS